MHVLGAPSTHQFLSVLAVQLSILECVPVGPQRPAVCCAVLCCATARVVQHTVCALAAYPSLPSACSVLVLGRRVSLSPPSLSICNTRVVRQTHQTVFVHQCIQTSHAARFSVPTEACCCLPVCVTGHAAAAASCSRGCRAGAKGRGIPPTASTGGARMFWESGPRVEPT